MDIHSKRYMIVDCKLSPIRLKKDEILQLRVMHW